jgi:hypothetical protein
LQSFARLSHGDDDLAARDAHEVDVPELEDVG